MIPGLRYKMRVGTYRFFFVCVFQSIYHKQEAEKLKQWGWKENQKWF